jgi:hypothetical protein
MVNLSTSPVALYLIITATAVACSATQIHFPAVPTTTTRANVVYDNFLGISWELSSFDTLWGANVSTVPPTMLNYLANIRARMNNNLRIRVGGNGMDASVYDRNLKDVMLTIPNPDAYYNEIPVIFGPTIFGVLNEVQKRVGSMQFMLGASTRNPQDFAQGAQLSQDALDELGGSLDAILLGNVSLPHFTPPQTAIMTVFL